MIAHLPMQLALLPAVLLTPYLLVRLLVPSLGLTASGAITGAVSFMLNALVPLLLHLLRVPIHAPSLAASHWTIFLVVCIAHAAKTAWHRRVGSMPPRCDDRASDHGSWDGTLICLLAIAFALLVFPITHLAGIDTYKWQDLATAVRVEQAIPWLVHPLSLFGFTPRSYPSIQPLTLASIQILGRLGVDGGYYVMSLLSGLTGLFAALWLGEILFSARVPTMLFVFFYVFSPVFMRYNHWATGRGVFVALLPLFLIACIRLPHLKAMLALPILAAMLCLTHKAGIVAVPLILVALPFGWMLPRRDVQLLRILLVIPFAAAAFLLAGHGLLSSAREVVLKSVTRFGWYIPAAALAILCAREWWSRPAWRLLFFPALLAFPLAFYKEMYGALVALPFVCHATTVAMAGAMDRWPRRQAALLRAAVLLGAAAALAIVVNRSLAATPRDVWRAAMFLERYDPFGPFRIDASEMARTQVQAYCSGCPRFTVQPADTSAAIVLRPPPPLHGPPRAVAQAWIDYLRHALAAGETGVDWYGANPRLYWLVIDGAGSRPGGHLLYRTGNVELYAPVAQPDPPRAAAASPRWRRS